MSADDHNVERAATRRKVLLSTGSATMLGLAGCLGDDDDETDDEEPTESGDDSEQPDDGTGSGDDTESTVTFLVEGIDYDHGESVSQFDVIDRDTGEVTADVHGDHWHGELPHIHEGEHISLGASIEDDHGDEIELDGDHYELGITHGHDAPGDVVSFDTHGDHVHIIGDYHGESAVVFQLLHDGHVEYETPAIAVTVEDDDHGHEDESVSQFDVIDRETDEVAAYVDGDHWHGELPHVHEGEHISLGASIEDDHGDEIELDGDHYTLNVNHGHDAPGDVVSFDTHGDHVHIIGDHHGDSEVVFQLLHDGHVEYETPAIGVTVEDDHDHDDHDDETVSQFDLIDRETDEVAAYVDGDHWHGELPHVHEGEHISLGASIEDDHGDEIELDGDHYELGVTHGHDAPGDVVSFDTHGDHVHIIGDYHGESAVVFQLLHDGHVEYETPAIAVTVEDEDHGHDDHDYETDGLTHDDIDHACGHLEFDEPEALTGGSTAEEAPVIDATHQPYDVTVTESGYVRFDAGEDAHGLFGLFVENGTVSLIEGDLVYDETTEVQECGPMDYYVLAEPDHGEIVVELTAN